MPKSTRKSPKSQAVQTTQLLALLAALMAVPAMAGDVRKPIADPMVEVSPDHRIPKVQIAILLDNSGSMEGLLNQARAQLWKIVNTFSTAKRGGQRPRLEIALYEYGDGVKRLSAFTSDLDAVSEKLFALPIRGGDEYCGQVIQSATKELEWSGNPDDLKLIYIAGNEPFTQGPVNYRTAITQAKAKGIAVNTIVCGGEDPTWRDGAIFASGDHFVINQNAAIAYVAAPQDQEIARLGAELNKTYIGYGAQGAVRREMQAKQDANAASAAPAAVISRSVSKSTALYKNSSWDLVDAAKDGDVKVEAMKEEDLPAEMKPMKVEERKKFVEEKAKERADIQQKIADLNKQREAFVAAQAQSAPADQTLDTALIESVKSQGTKKAFSF